EREQARHRGFGEWIAAQPPHALGGVGKQVAAAQDGRGAVDVVAVAHRASLAKPAAAAFAATTRRSGLLGTFLERRAQNGALSDFFTTRFLPGSKRAAVTSGRAGSMSPDSGRVAFFAAFFAGDFPTVFFAAFFAVAFFAGAFFAAFFAAFLAPKPRRAGLPVSSSRRVASSRLSEAGSRSFGILPLRRPSLRYGP